jgi:hypothetical protein
MVVVTVSIHFRKWTRIWIQNPRVTDPAPAKVPDHCGSGSTLIDCADVLYYDNYVKSIVK